MTDNLHAKPSPFSAVGNSRTCDIFAHVINNNDGVRAVFEEQPLTCSKNPRNWADAPVFVPRWLKPPAMDFELDSEGSAALDGITQIRVNGMPPLQVINSTSTICELNTSEGALAKKTWADVVAYGNKTNHRGLPSMVIENRYYKSSEVCPYRGPCPNDANCSYKQHMQMCNVCGEYILHPFDLESRRTHIDLCQKKKAREEERARGLARSKGKTCGICLEVVLDKDGSQRRFGILPSCSHVFCLSCIRKWRQTKHFDNQITRSCPQCRVKSDFVVPSEFWIESEEDKKKLLQKFRKSVSTKHCKYFRRGSGVCPFGNKCFYKHALLTGELAEGGHPNHRRFVFNSANDVLNIREVSLWDFVEQREENFHN